MSLSNSYVIMMKILCHKGLDYVKIIQKLCHKFENLSIHQIDRKELIKMVNDEKERTTVYINPEIWQLARMKAKCSGSRLIEELLIDFIGNDGNIIGYEEKIKESEEIIRKEKAKIKQYKKTIQLLEEEMMKNGENIKLLGECTERIKQYHSRYKFVSVQFLLRLSKIKNMPMEKLQEICHYNEFEIRSVKEPKD